MNNKVQNNEQILKIKGLYIDMNIEDASQIISKLLDISCKVTSFDEEKQTLAMKSDFSVKYVIWDDRYLIDIRADEDKKVKYIAFPNYAVDKIFNVSGVSAEEFVKQFADGYHIPPMKNSHDKFGRNVWEYTNEYGCKIQISSSKALTMMAVPKKSEMKFD